MKFVAKYWGTQDGVEIREVTISLPNTSGGDRRRPGAGKAGIVSADLADTHRRVRHDAGENKIINSAVKA